MTCKPDEEQLRELIMEQAAMHNFDHNPLLNTLHTVTCNRCNHEFKTVYLDHLKSGRFRVGTPQAIEGENPFGAFLIIEEERATPVIFELPCKKCGNIIDVRPLTVEWLSLVVSKKDASKMMFS
jgi:uncharacterized Zn finger protein